jgi:hypothetical protein
MATNCSNCNNCKDECSCIPTGVTTPNYCLSDTPPCPEPAPCTETFDSQCVIYTGDGNECIGIEADQTVEEIIDILAQKLEPLICLGCVTAVIPSNNAIEVPLNQVIAWAPVANATGYDVYFSTNELNVINSNPSVLVSSNQISTNYDPTGLLDANTIYYWKVVPRNGPVQVINCITYKFTTFAACINPLVDIFDTITDSIIPLPDPEDLTKYIIDLITNTFNNGLVLGKACGACCPDCETGRYVLSSVIAYPPYYSATYKAEPPVLTGSPCCIQVTSTYSVAYQEYLQVLSEAPSTGICDCDSNYDVCLEQLKDLFSAPVWTTILQTGIVEESTLGGYTSLCILRGFIASLPSALSESQKAEILQAILNVGIVVECTENSITIISIETYLGPAV